MCPFCVKYLRLYERFSLQTVKKNLLNSKDRTCIRNHFVSGRRSFTKASPTNRLRKFSRSVLLRMTRHFRNCTSLVKLFYIHNMNSEQIHFSVSQICFKPIIFLITLFSIGKCIWRNNPALFRKNEINVYRLTLIPPFVN